MFEKALVLYFLFKTALVTCNYETRKEGFEKERSKITRVGILDKIINESSGICFAPSSQNLLSINDSGGKPEVYEVNQKGKLIKIHTIPDAKNVDWEEITTDDKGNIYIGDFGNNSNQRKDLCIYKFDGKTTQRINFSYKDQTHSNKREYDCEAFFWKSDSLYLFTKSWEKGVKISRLYSVSDQAGTYQLSPSREINLEAQITGAAISPQKDKFALISYGKIFTFNIKNQKIDFDSPEYCLKMAKKQTEAIMFWDKNQLLFTNEQGRIYKLEI